MSAGLFIESKYVNDAGVVFPVRVQPETELFTLGGTANDAPAAALTPGVPQIPLKVGRKTAGLAPRTVTVKATTAPTGPAAGYKGVGTTFVIPVLDPVVWAGYGKGQTGTYNTMSVDFVRKSPELNPNAAV